MYQNFECKFHGRIFLRIFLTAIFICAIFTENGYAATRFPTEEISQNFADFHREDLNLYAKSAVLTDADTGRILYGKDAGTPMANANEDHDLSAGDREWENTGYGDIFGTRLQHAKSAAWLSNGDTVCTGRFIVFPDAGIPQ